MRITDFSSELPEPLIAHYSMLERSSCHLPLLDGPTGALAHGIFTDLLDKFNPGDLLVFNSTRAIPMHLSKRKVSGGKIEILAKRILDDKRILVHVRAPKALRPGAGLLLSNNENIDTVVTARHGTPFEVEFNNQCPVLDILNNIGHMPLPSYIDHPDEDASRELHQAVYSEKSGAVAAPTAELHFDGPLLGKLRAKGVEMAFMTLHVSTGTFQPVHVNTIEDHIMHSEYAGVSQDVVDAALAVKTRGNRVIVVGTTSVHSSKGAAQAAKNNLIEPFFDDAQVFIRSGLQCGVVDVLVTNFHLPESTLIMLISVFAGYRHTMNAYKTAVEEKYHFFGYGNVMFITYSPQAISERIGK